MAARRDSGREELLAMKRVDLQRLAKDLHIPANLKTELLIDKILHARLTQSTSTASTASPRRGQPDLDEQENLPEPKLASESPSRMRKGKEAHTKLGVGRPKPTGGDGIRKTTSVQSLVIPPGVVAANSDSPKLGKGKGRPKKTIARGATDSALVLSKTASLESVATEDNVDDDAVMRTPRNSSTLPIVASSSQLSPSHSDPTSIAMLDSRVGRLEDESDATENELRILRHQLREAQHSIAELTRQNVQLRSQIDSVQSVASTDQISNIFERLSLLEDYARGLTPRQRAASISSSEADLSTPPVRKMELKTPPNQIGLMNRGSLAPAFHLQSSRRDSGRRHTPLRPPTEPRRYTNPDESPSPTRPIHATAELSLGGQPGTYSRNSTYAPPNLPSNQSSVSRQSQRDNAKSKRSRPSMKMEESTVTLGGLDGEDSDAYERTRSSPDFQAVQPIQLVPSSSRSNKEKSSHRNAPPPLPYPIVASSPSPASEVTMHTPTPSRRRRIVKTARKSRPYDQDSRPERYSITRNESPDPLSVPNANPVTPGNMRDIFGSTPDPTRVPPLPLVDGKIPHLQIERSHSASYAVRETPQSSPFKGNPVNPPETPPASRTRYGTEIGSATRARFSDNEGPAPWNSR